MKNILLSSVLGVSLAVSSCSMFQKNPTTYSEGQLGVAQEFRMGRVIQIREVEVDRPSKDSNSTIGTAAGAIIGGVIGAAVGLGGGDTQDVLGGAAGAAVGGAVGNKVGSATTKMLALELTVKGDAGDTFIVIQGRDQQFSPGERVKIIEPMDGTTLISKTNTF